MSGLGLPGESRTPFPPPLRGRVRVGGMPAAARRSSIKACRLSGPVPFEAIRPKPSGGSGVASVKSNWMGIASAASIQLVPMSSTSFVLMQSSSSRSMMLSMRSRKTKIPNERNGLLSAAIASSASGTATCCQTSKASLRRSGALSSVELPPHPGPPPPGARGQTGAVPSNTIRLHGAGDA